MFVLLRLLSIRPVVLLLLFAVGCAEAESQSNVGTESQRNGFAFLYPILRTYESNAKLEEEYCVELGIDYPVEQKKVLIPFKQYQKKRFPQQDDDQQEELHQLTLWYKEHEQVIDTIREALQYPDFHIVGEPVSLAKNKKSPKLADMFFGSVASPRTVYGDLRELQRFLIAGASIMAEEKRYDDLFETLMLLKQFGAALATSVDVRFQLLGIGIEGSAMYRHNDLFLADTLSAEWYRSQIEKLVNRADFHNGSAIPPEIRMERYIRYLDEAQNDPNTRENLFFFESLQRRLSKDTGGLIEAEGPSEREKTVNEWFPKIDWDKLKQMIQPWGKRMAEMAELPTYTERIDNFRQIEAEMKIFSEKHQSPRTSTLTELAAAVIFPPLLDVEISIDEARTRNQTIGEMLIIHYAIAAYRFEHKDYPKSLADVLFMELPELPNDPFSNGKPFGYCTFEGGCVVYSVGKNGTLDKEGKAFSIRIGLPDNSGDLFWDPSGDDIGFFQLDANQKPKKSKRQQYTLEKAIGTW